MSMYQHIQQAWKRPKASKELWRARLIAWRREEVTTRIARPTRLDRARNLGYKPKLGVLMIRQRVKKGPHKHAWRGGRRSRNMGIITPLRKSYKLIAEERANKKYPNCEVLNSYWVAKDGKHYWYEIILIDRDHPTVKADKSLSGVAKKRGRVFRGLTSAGKEMRGLHHKGKGAEKARPSRRAHSRKL